MAINTVPRADLESIVAAFAAVLWPAPGAAVKEIGADLGWTVRFDMDNGVTFVTEYAIDSPKVNVMFADGDIGQVSIDVSDRVRNPDAAQSKTVAAASRLVRDDVASFLGAPVRARTGKDARYTWDLSNGGRVAVALLGPVVQLIVLQKRYADLERREEGLDISDERDPAADL